MHDDDEQLFNEHKAINHSDELLRVTEKTL